MPTPENAERVVFAIAEVDRIIQNSFAHIVAEVTEVAALCRQDPEQCKQRLEAMAKVVQNQAISVNETLMLADELMKDAPPPPQTTMH